MKTKIFLMPVIFFFIGICSVNAQIKAHQKAQVHRVKNGEKSGEITGGEMKALKYRNHEMKQDVRLAKSDGKVTAPERKILKNEQSKNSELIYKAKHNDRSQN